jgi:hypothetical protein
MDGNRRSSAVAKVAEVLVETLIEAGVKRVYGVAGDSLNGMTETIRKSDKIDWLHVRHEEVAAFAAGVEAHLTNGIAVCAGSCGPGNLHLINGLFDCHRSRVPVLAMPRTQSIGGFTLAFAGAIFCASWVFTSSPRIAYAGRQMALSYDLVHLSDPRYNIGLPRCGIGSLESFWGCLQCD